jgi:hypothetical protein
MNWWTVWRQTPTDQFPAYSAAAICQFFSTRLARPGSTSPAPAASWANCSVSSTRHQQLPAAASDLDTTILHQLGLDSQLMEVKTLGRIMKLVEEGDGPIREII